MSIAAQSFAQDAVADAGTADSGKTKGPPVKRQMTALKDQPLVPEAR